MKVSWFDRVRNEEVLRKGREKQNVLLTVNRKKSKWIGHILRSNCLLKHVTGEVSSDRKKRKNT